MAISSNATMLTPSLVSPKPRLLRSSSGRRSSLPFALSSATATPNTVDAGRLTINGNAVESTQTPLPPVASMWRRIQGTDDWKNLLEPLSPVLREEIVRYGEFVLACYKVFDLDPTSDRYLNSKYGKATMFHDAGMEDSGYKVTKYIYAAPGIDIPSKAAACRSRWIGYVAVSTDEAAGGKLGRRDILVAFRGTVTSGEWIANLMSSLNPARLDPQNPRPDVKVQSGFLGLYTSGDSTCRFGCGSCREQLLSEVTRILREHSSEEEVSITLAGHSMGSSLALLLGYDLAELGLNRDGSGREIPVTVYSFGGPRVGNQGFKERCEALGVKVLRVVNVHDPVTKMPGFLLNEHFRVLAGRFVVPWSCSCYAHVGVELALDFSKGKGPVEVHDLDAYIGLLKCYDSTNNLAAIKNNIKGSGNLLLSRLERFFVHAWPWRDAVARNVRP